MISAEVVAGLVARSRAAQGLPEKITDPAALRRIAALLSPRRDEAPATTPGRSLTTVLPLAKEAERSDVTP